MTAIGGPIIELAWAGRTFSSAGDASVSTSLGGKTNAIEPNGNSTTRNIQTVIPWSCEGAAVNIDTDRGDHEFLQERTDAGLNEVFTVTYSSGAVYQGKGVVVGEIKHDTSKATAALAFGGPGTLTKQ